MEVLEALGDVLDNILCPARERPRLDVVHLQRVVREADGEDVRVCRVEAERLYGEGKGGERGVVGYGVEVVDKGVTLRVGCREPLPVGTRSMRVTMGKPLF